MTVPCGDVSALPRGLDVAGLLGNIDTVLHQELVTLLRVAHYICKIGELYISRVLSTHLLLALHQGTVVLGTYLPLHLVADCHPLNRKYKIKIV